MPWLMAAFIAFPLYSGFVLSHYGAGKYYLRMLGFDEETVRSLNRWTLPLVYFTFLPFFLVAGMEFTGMAFRSKDLVEVILFFLPLPMAAAVFIALILKKRRFEARRPPS